MFFLFTSQRQDKKKHKMKINVNWKNMTNITEWNKNHTQKNMESVVCCPATSGQQACLGIWLTYTETPGWKKCIFPFLKMDHLRSGSWWGWAFVSTSLAPCWALVWFEPRQDFCLFPQSLWVHVCINPVMSEWQFSWNHPPTSGLTVGLTDSSWTLVTESLRSLTRTSYLGLMAPKSLMLPRCESLSQLPFAIRKSLVYKGWVILFKNMSLGAILLLCFFNRIIVICFLVSPRWPI